MKTSDNKEKKQLRELSEEELKEVTGGGNLGGINILSFCLPLIIGNPCPSMKFDNQCKCIE